MLHKPQFELNDPWYKNDLSFVHEILKHFYHQIEKNLCLNL